MTSAIPGGFRIATGFLKIVADDKEARRDTKRFIRDTDREMGRGGDRSGRSFGLGFLSGLRGTLRRAVSPLVSVMSGAVKAFLTLNKLAVVAGVVATAVGGLASAVASLVPALAELIQVAVAASGSLLLIPGAVAALIGIVATAKLGMKGFGDALKAIGSGDVEKLNEALKRLAPNAAKVVRELQKLKPGFDRLQLRIQNTLFTGLAVQVKALGGTLLPALMGSLDNMAAVLNGVVRDGLAFLLDAGTRSDLVLIFDAAARSVGNLGQAFRPLLNIVRDVTAVSALMLANFTGGAGAAVTRWADRITQLRAEGTLAGIITDSFGALKQFGQLVLNIGGILRGVFNASGAGGLFAFFDRLNELINSLSGQAALREIFAALREVGIALIPVVLVLAQGLARVLTAVAPLAQALAPGLIALVKGLATGLVALGPGLAALAPLFATAGMWLPKIGQGLSRLLAAGVPGLDKFLNGLGMALGTIADVAGPLGAAIGSLLGALGPALVPIAGILSQLIIGLAPGVVSVLNGLTAAFGALTPVVPQIASDLSDFLTSLEPVIAALGPVLGPLLADLADEFAQLARVIAPVAPLLAADLVVFTPLLELILKFLVALAIWWLKIPEIGGAIARHIIAPLQDARKSVESFGSAVSERIGAALGFFRNLGTTVLNALSNFTGLLYNSGRALIQGLINGIQSMVRPLTDRLAWITNLIPDWKGPLDRDKRLLFGAGQATMQGYIRGLTSQVPNLAGLLGGITANVPAMATAGPSPAAAAAPSGPAYFGPYEMHVDGDVFHRFVIDAVTGNPVDVARAVDEGQRQRGYRDSSRKRIGTRR